MVERVTPKSKIMIVDALFIRVMILWSFVELCVDENLVMGIVIKGSWINKLKIYYEKSLKRI